MLIKRAEQTSCRVTCFWGNNIKNEELVVCENSKILQNSQDILNMIVWKNLKGFFLACLRSASHMVSISGCYRPFSISKDNHVHKLWDFGVFLQFLKIIFFWKTQHKIVLKNAFKSKLSQSRRKALPRKCANFQFKKWRGSAILARDNLKFDQKSTFWWYGAPLAINPIGY